MKVTTDQLIADYRRGLTLREIGARHDLHYTGVRERLQAAGVLLRRPGQYERTEAQREHYAALARQQHAEGRARPFGNSGKKAA